MKQNWDGARKALAREESPDKSKTYQSVLTLPGKPCDCVAKFVEMGVIVPSTKLVFVEHKKQFVPQIKSNFARKFGNFFLQEPLYETCELANLTRLGPYDFLNLDTCSVLSKSLLGLLTSLQYREGADLALNVTVYRGKTVTFYNKLKEVFLDFPQGKQVVRWLDNKIDGMSTLDVVNLAAIVSVLSDYELEVLPPISYCDHVNPMHLYRLRNLRFNANCRPSFADLFGDNDEVVQAIYPERTRTASTLDTDNSLSSLIVAAETVGARAYTTKRLRQLWETAPLVDKSPKMAIAGVKATIRKLVTDNEQCDKLHQYVDNAIGGL